MFKKSIFKKSILVGAILSLLAVPFAMGTSVKAEESSVLESIKVMSYNIHHGVGADGRLDLKRIGDVIKNSNADVIGLQELDNNWDRSNYVDQAKWLANYLGMEYVYGPNLIIGNTQYGNAVLSKYPIVSSENHFLSGGSERRGLLETVVDFKGTQFRFFNTHIDYLSEGVKTQQIKEVLEWGGKNEGPAIFVGDYNSKPDTAPIQPMMQAYNDVFGLLGQNEDFTDPLPNPEKRIDYVFASKNIGIKDAEVLQTDVHLVASDHLPIIADLMFGSTEIQGKILNSITAPAPVKAAIGTAKTAAALGLPTKVTLVTDVRNVTGSVNWDLNSASYDPTATTAQTFTVTGEVILPLAVTNPNSVPLTTSISVSTKPAELVAHWKFDEGSGTTVGDSSGKGNIGTLVNNPTWTDSGKGGALAFSGGSRAEFNSSATLNKTGDESVSLWFKTSQPATVTTSIFRNSNRFTALQLAGGQARVAYWPNASSSYKALYFPWTYSDSKWHHYVASYDQLTGLKIYVDGNLVASNTTNLGPLPTVTNKIVLGANESGGEAYKGLLDDVRVFDLPLTQDEVRQLSDLQPPTTTDNAPSGWVNQDVNVTLSASDNESGVANTYYTVDDSAEQTGTTVVLSEEGVQKLVYWSVDKAGNVEQAHTVSVSIDKKAPSIAVTVPGDNSIYEGSGDLTPQIKLTDNLSGVDISKTTVKLDSHSYQIGTTIPLYTLPLGQHTLVVSSSDLAGNQVSKTVQFTTATRIDSLKALVKRFVDTKWIDNAGIADSLQDKLANNDLKSFVSEVKAQSGKHISSEAATYLLRDAQYVLSQK
ncbi:endonuclease/exonuclease/phosphatase family protein [Neobacillus drentensis]|uniref:endonuclease/exonuclease/phosphatase family protein n=1 Tax=Neobacillus drentensis TaxID=220684 RepID=UPI002FFE67FD